MAYWLLKSEPATWSWNDQICQDKEAWTGVRNHQAARFLKTMQRGDQAFFYHSGKKPAIVGIVQIITCSYPDPTDTAGRFVCVDVQAQKALSRVVTLTTLKENSMFSNMLLLRQPRLSVVPVSEECWRAICELGGL